MPTDKKPAITLQICHNDYMLLVAMPCRLFTAMNQHCPFPFVKPGYDYQQQPRMTRNLLDALNSIEGLTEAFSSDAYTFRIKRASAFPWNELLLEILPALFQAYNDVKKVNLSANDFNVTCRNLSADPDPRTRRRSRSCFTSPRVATRSDMSVWRLVPKR